MKTDTLSLTLIARAGRRPLSLPLQRLIVAGWVGRDRAQVRHHIEELGKLGVPPPTRTPTYMNLWTGILSTSQHMDVVGPESSGEVECVVFKWGKELYIGVGSDHTDRAFEKYDIPASKQMCPKIVAPAVWPYQEVRDHLDSLVLRSWVTDDEHGRRLYQEGSLSLNLGIEELLAGIPAEDDLPMDHLCLFCGTLPTEEGIIYSRCFEFEMEDPVLGRRIQHGYTISVLPQYL